MSLQISPTARYDYIITGSGCAGLSLVMHMMTEGSFQEKKILLLDRDAKTSNDRTWCFWENGKGLFQSIVYKEWEKLWFYSEDISKQLHIQPYTYKLIRGIDFYQYCFSKLKQYPNISFKQASVENIISNENETYVIAEGNKIHAHYIFNSILFQKPSLKARQFYLLQHFTGWYIKTSEPVFVPGSATLMDFRTAQEKGTSFFYVLPFSETTALVEYTLFSPALLSKLEYEVALKSYIEEQLQIRSYTIYNKEFGSIPMTNYRFPIREKNIINIGTAGGQTKSSSGYTFQFIQKQSKAIVNALTQGDHPGTFRSGKKRFRFYDSILLHILHHQNLEGKKIFKLLFERNKPVSVLRFLDNETSLIEDLGIFGSLPVIPFLRAAIRQLGR